MLNVAMPYVQDSINLEPGDLILSALIDGVHHRTASPKATMTKLREAADGPIELRVSRGGALSPTLLSPTALAALAKHGYPAAWAKDASYGQSETSIASDDDEPDAESAAGSGGADELALSISRVGLAVSLYE